MGNKRHNPDATQPKGNWRTVQPTSSDQPNLIPLDDFRGPQGADFDAVSATLKAAAGRLSRIQVAMSYGKRNVQQGVAIEIDDSGIVRIARLSTLTPANTPQRGEHDVIALVHRAADGKLYAEFAS